MLFIGVMHECRRGGATCPCIQASWWPMEKYTPKELTWCNTGRLLARAGVILHDDKGHDALKHYMPPPITSTPPCGALDDSREVRPRSNRTNPSDIDTLKRDWWLSTFMIIVDMHQVIMMGVLYMFPHLCPLHISFLNQLLVIIAISHIPLGMDHIVAYDIHPWLLPCISYTWEHGQFESGSQSLTLPHVRTIISCGWLQGHAPYPLT